jgi:hypothetical protein
VNRASGEPRRAARRALRALVLAALIVSGATAAQDTAPVPAFRPGMAWSYNQRDELGNHQLANVRVQVVAVAANQVTVSRAAADGPAVNDLWDAIGNWDRVSPQACAWLSRLGANDVDFAPALALYRFPLEAGKSWVDSGQAIDPDTGRKTPVKVFAKALAWEEVTVPAGKFRALKVRRLIAPEDGDATRSPTTVTLIDWYAPQVSGTVRRICDWEYHDLRQPSPEQIRRGPRLRLELTAFEAAK